MADKRYKLSFNFSDGTEQEVEFTAPEGPQGVQGPKGDKGEKGDQGIQGLQGEKGDKGDQGEQGLQGEKGDTGATGPQGETGIQGPKGDTGSQGIQGYGFVTSVARPSFTESKWTLYGEIGHAETWSETDSIRNGCRIGDIFTVVGTATDTKNAHVAYYRCETSSGNLRGTCIAHSIAERGATGATGSKGADGKTPVKGTDYFTEADKKEMVESVVASLDGIPDYWQTALQDGANEIRQAMETAGRKKSAFLFYSDAHWDYGSRMSPKLLKYLYKHTAVNKTFFGGDIVNSESTDRDVMKYLYEWREMLRDLPNHHSVVGNHDDGNATNNLFSTNYIYSYLLAAEETPQVVQGSDMYYYIDEPCEKTRYLFLDTAYKGLDDDQKAFITDTLKSTPSGWHIVVVAHIWYMPDYDQYNVRPIPLTGLSTDATTVTAILDNYNSRTGEFADCEGWVEFCIGGHVHRDYDGTTTTGIPIILVETDSQHIRSEYSYTAGTTTEASVNGIIADYENHKIYVVRIGRGESREITVTNYVVSYTNVLPLALDADGVSVYNSKGWKENTRWSQSGQVEKEATGQCLTGYIPCSQGDIIRLKNISALESASTTYLLSTNTLGASEQGLDVAGMKNWCNAIFDDSGNLAQLTAPDYSYFRLSCATINETSIITINEPIE